MVGVIDVIPLEHYLGEDINPFDNKVIRLQS